MGHRLLILAWHNVTPSWCFPFEPGSGIGGLERQLGMLRRTANVVALRPSLEALAEGRSLPPRAVALTFDDGYRDNLDQAAPMLHRMGLPATFFFVSGLLDRTVEAWWEVLGWAFARARRSTVEWEGLVVPLDDPACRQAEYRRIADDLKLRDRPAREAAVGSLVEALHPDGEPPDASMFLDWDGARAIARDGFDVGSHSAAHEILSEEPVDEQRRALRESRQRLEQELGVTVDVLAYPNGRAQDYDDDTIAAARAAGYGFALTTVDGWNTPATPHHELRRFVMYPERGRVGLGVVVRHAARRLKPAS